MSEGGYQVLFTSKWKQCNLRYLSAAAVIITMSSFIGGYQIGVFNTCQEEVSNTLKWEGTSKQSRLISLGTGLMPLGAVFGSICGGFAANRLGRLRATLIACVVAIVNSGLVRCMQTFIPSTEVFMVARFLGGMVAGANFAVAPVFRDFYTVKEITPVAVNGFFGSFVQIQITFGICVSYAMGILLSVIYYDPPWWQFMFLLPGVIAGVQAVLLVTVVRLDTPEWLHDSLKDAEANRHLKRIYSPAFYRPYKQPSDEVSMQRYTPSNPNPLAHKDSELSNDQSFIQMFYAQYRKQLISACGLVMFQQLSGINTFIFYSSYIVYQIDPIHEVLPNRREFIPSLFTTLMGVFNMLTTLIILPFIDSKSHTEVSRKGCLLFGFFGMCLCNAVLALLFLEKESMYLVLVAMLCFVVCFEVSAGPIAWIYAPEVLPERGVSIVVIVDWVFTAAVGFLYPVIYETWRDGGAAITFFLFCGCCLLAVAFVYCCVVETSGRSSEEIEKGFRSR